MFSSRINSFSFKTTSALPTIKLLQLCIFLRYWLCAASGPSIKVWDLESKHQVEDLRPEVAGSARAEPPQCTALAWSSDGQTLFAGYSDNLIRVWQVSMAGTR